MHYAVKKFIKEVKAEFPYKFRLRSVLEIGSHNINGSPRSFFYFCNYTGVDISRGKGVDLVGKFSEVKLKDEYGIVVSTEMLEHDRNWKEDLKLMYEKLAYKGLMIVTCASLERPEHGTFRTQPWCSPDTTDYYRNISIEDFKSVLPPDLFEPYVLQTAQGGRDLQFYGIKNLNDKINFVIDEP